MINTGNYTKDNVSCFIPAWRLHFFVHQVNEVHKGVQVIVLHSNIFKDAHMKFWIRVRRSAKLCNNVGNTEL